MSELALTMTVDVQQAASITKCHPDTLRKMAKAGEVPATKVGRAWVFSVELLKEWIEARCLSIDARVAPSGGSALAAKLANQRARRIKQKQKNSSASSKSDSGDVQSSETALPSRGEKSRKDG